MWWVDLDPVRGHEQGGRRPAVVVSVDRLNHSRIGLVVTCPLTRTERPRLLDVLIDPPEANLRYRCWALIDQVRSISTERFGMRIGRVSPTTATAIDDRLRRVLFP